MQVTLTKAEQLKTKPDENKLGFGTIFTDHMFNMDYSVEKGWYNPRIEPYAPLMMAPSTMVLHYGQGVFEGLKAYRNAKGGVQLFRPQENFKRLNASNHKLCIPEIDEAFALDALKQLLTVENDWVPSAPGTSLYIRPTIIATDPFLGVRASFTYRFFIILSPVGAYYAEGFSPVKIMVTKEHVRAQVLWLDGVEQKYVEEVGAMNIFFVIDDELITPMLSGSILPGITRDSVLELGRSWGMTVSEKKISIDEVMNAHASGHLKEIFGSGTAAVIAPVGELKYEDTVITVGDGQVGPLAHKLFQALQDIQYGAIEDPQGWIEAV
ncbi:MAG: branched-chain-amino-acid transaminase [Desulfosarcina sp.]|nr:branched-chain-amino-acid transaminase [Desulfosarcina sp.]